MGIHRAPQLLRLLIPRESSFRLASSFVDSEAEVSTQLTVADALKSLKGTLRTRFMMSVHPDLLQNAEPKIREANETSLKVRLTVVLNDS